MYFTHKTGRGMYVRMYGKKRSVHRGRRSMYGNGSEELLLSKDLGASQGGSGIPTTTPSIKKIQEQKPGMDRVIRKLEGLSIKSGVKKHNISFQI